jgi:hypothetical protein
MPSLASASGGLAAQLNAMLSQVVAELSATRQASRGRLSLVGEFCRHKALMAQTENTMEYAPSTLVSSQRLAIAITPWSGSARR